LKKKKRPGCYCVDENCKHPEWFSPITGRLFYLSHHKSEEAKTGTVKSISKNSGVQL